jgi:hypothetical protein
LRDSALDVGNCAGSVYLEIFRFRSLKPWVNIAGVWGVKEMSGEKPSR